MAKGLTKTYGSLTFMWDGEAETVKIEGVGSTTNETLAEKFDEFFHLCFPNAPTARKTPDE
jgi:hypothetical protein